MKYVITPATIAVHESGTSPSSAKAIVVATEDECPGVYVTITQGVDQIKASDEAVPLIIEALGSMHKGANEFNPIPLSRWTVDVDFDALPTERTLVQKAIDRARRGKTPLPTYRWEIVEHMFGVRRQVAIAICHKYGFDPDQVVSGGKS